MVEANALSHISGRTLHVRIPSEEFQHVGDRYGDLIGEAIDNLGLEIDQVVFQVPPQEAPVRVREDGGFAPQPSHSQNAPRRGNGNSMPAGPEQSRFDWNTAAQLNPRYQFDSFVIGSGNQFAQAAAQAVAERPSKAYNPLFVYGGVGLGKTHLMQAIGHLVKARNPLASVSYVSGEKFTNEIDQLGALRQDDRLPRQVPHGGCAADRRYPVPRRQGAHAGGEFFHTFNALHEQSKQIVVASDRPPKELNDFEDAPALAL